MFLNSENISGEGRPLLLLHGWGQSLNEMKPLGNLLSRAANPYLIDLPGFGKSEPPPEGWSAFDYADRLHQFLDDHQIQKTDLLGHSFGGKVAICFAARYPERVGRLILLASAGLKAKPSLRNKMIRFAGKTLKSLSRPLYEQFFIPRFASTDYLNAGPMRSILVRSVNEDLSHTAREIRCPTLILWGKRDTETPLWMGKRLQQLIPDASFIPFAQHGHQLHLGGGAHLAASKIIPFLESHA